MILNTVYDYLIGEPKSNVFIVDQPMPTPKLQDAVSRLHYEFIYLNGKEISTSMDFWMQIKDGMNFPDYFGFNWDATLDCLRDLSWYSVKPTRLFVYYEDFTQFAVQDQKQFEVALKTLTIATLTIDFNATLIFVLSGELRYLPSLLLNPVFPRV